MNIENNKLAIMASEECRRNRPGKRWWHLRRFVSAYARLLQQYSLEVTTSTAAILDEAIALERQTNPECANLQIRRVGRSFEGVVHIAAAVAKREIS